MVANSGSRVILCWSADSLLLGYPLSRLFRRRCIVRCAGADIYSTDMIAKSWKEKIFKLNSGSAMKLLPRADHIIVNSEFMKQYLELHQIPSKSIVKIHNGVDVPLNREVRGTIVGPIKLISVGRLSKGIYGDKQQDTLLKAFVTFHRMCPESMLTLVGDGPERAMITDLAFQLGISNSVKITGRLPSEQVLDLLGQSDVFVFPSANEGLSNALLEAVLSGLPIVASDIQPNREVLEGVEGSVLFAVGSSGSLLEGLLTVVKDIDNRKAQARQSAIRLERIYSMKNVVESYERVLFGPL